MPNTPLMLVRDLGVQFPVGGGHIAAVRELTFSVNAKETVAIVGESGSGKSSSALALLGLLPRAAKTTGSVLFEGTELLGAGDKVWQHLRGARIAYVPQNPFGSLNPVYTIGQQIVEAITAHDGHISRDEARVRALELIESMGIDNPLARFDAYPHQISGGMRQRAVIAMALANRPSLIVADEPTSALDVTVQAQVLDALDRAREVSSASLLLITHDLGLVARHADRVVVMYGGRCVESGSVATVFAQPRMPYTMGLLGAVPRIDISAEDPLVRMPAPSAQVLEQGCQFADRCPAATEICATDRPALRELGGGHQAACHFADDMGRTTALTLFPTTETSAPTPNRADRPQEPLLSVQNLVKHFVMPHRASGTGSTVHAVCDISLEVMRGETLAVVGESGSGKTTLNRTLVRMEEPTSGTITLDGMDISHLSQRKLRPLRARFQMVLQDSTAALNPKLTVGALIREPLAIHGKEDPARVPELLTLVGLPTGVSSRFPGELSGGQRQRVAIARALAVEPDVLILDEPVSALDVSVQADVLALLREIQRKLGVSYIFVTHDLGVARHIADRVAVMYLGQIVESGAADDLLTRPAHPYTQALVSAVPIPDPVAERSRTRVSLPGDVPEASNPPSGCRFRTRCPLFKSLPDSGRQVCIELKPKLHPIEGATNEVACHFASVAVNA